MAGSALGTLFRLTTFGESHGLAIGGIVEGCPPGLALDEGYIQKHLDRRRPGQSRYTSQRREPDRVCILSGVFEGHTTGTPIALMVHNKDAKSRDYETIKDKYRPGHADYTYQHKYGRRDWRGGGRASARETLARVAAGAIARKYLQEHLGLSVVAWVCQVGPHRAQSVDLRQIEQNPFFAPCGQMAKELEPYMQKLIKDGDSVGARIRVQAQAVPVGLGEPVFARLDADLAAALMSINAVKAVAIGAGFDAVEQLGSQHRDEMTADGFASNNAGGILGGISSGQDIVADIALKPTSSIRLPGRTLDNSGNETQISTTGRHDPCVGIRAVPIAEAMMALVLMDHHLRHLAQCGAQS